MGLFGRRSPQTQTEKPTRLFFASDFHGSERTFRKFLNAGKHYGANILIMGGDIVGKLAIPIIREGQGGYRAHLMGKTEHLDGADALAALEQRLGTLGYYSKIMDQSEYEALRDDAEAVEAMFRELARKRLESWVDLAETRLADTGIRCFAIGGNDDFPEVLDTLNRAGARSFFYCEGTIVEIDEHHKMASVGYSTPTPWHTPREISEQELAQVIADLLDGTDDFTRSIFNFHVPPIDSTLDTCPELDWTTDPPSQIVRGGQVLLYGAGSKAVREAIEKHQPMLSLHGHIHESGGAVRIGRTLSVNPGSEYGEGVPRGCLMTLGKDEVKSYQLTAG